MNEGKKYYHEHQWRNLSQIARLHGMSRHTLHQRMKRGMTLREALSPPKPATKEAKPKHVPRTITFAGRTMTVAEWAEITGIARPTLWERITQHGWTIERALTEPVLDNIQRAQRGRNAKIIKRMLLGIHAQKLTSADTPSGLPNTGGYIETSSLSPRTGADRHAPHLQSEKLNG